MEKIYKFADFTLRNFVKGRDEDALYKVLGSPEVVRHMASDGISKSDCDNIISETEAHWKKYNIGSWAVEKDSNIIGWAGFKIWEENEFELLIVLGPNSWGLGRKIYTALISLAREEFNLNSLTIILPDTRKSFEFIVKKAGFKHVSSESYNGESFQKFILSLN